MAVDHKERCKPVQSYWRPPKKTKRPTDAPCAPPATHVSDVVHVRKLEWSGLTLADCAAGAATRSSLVHCPLKVPLLWLSKLSNPEAVGTRVRDLNAALAPAAPEQAVACLLSDECAASGALDHLLLSASSFTAESVGKEDKFSGGARPCLHGVHR